MMAESLALCPKKKQLTYTYILPSLSIDSANFYQRKAALITLCAVSSITQIFSTLGFNPESRIIKGNREQR
ncbi:hypothetical protein FGO68_gene952 [Halteria grandinella]|uniref:Uncharacterized protein n=1 Tax=Halteria grandinella TaxID=5974 RepID=A0A8J8SXF5_HALGN|nr:hypothetical protein FGO68_gene952 [Halteria grandinella]